MSISTRIGKKAEKVADQRRRWEENRARFDALRGDYPNLGKFSDPLKAPVREIVGREMERDQVLASLFRPELSNVILLAPAGSGKALVNGTMIPVNDLRGYVPIEELAIGDEVFGEDGRPVPVSGIFPQDRPLRVFTVTDAHGRSLDCNDEHLWTVRDNLDGTVSTKTLGEMLEEGIIYHTNRDNDEIGSFAVPRWSIPGPKAVARDMDLTDYGEITGPADVETWMLALSMPDRIGIMKALMATGTSMFDGVDIDVSGETHPGVVKTLAMSLGFAARMVSSSVLRVKAAALADDWVPIVSVIDHNREEEMTCIKVKSEAELFQAGLCHMVTHNTALVQATMLGDFDRLYVEVDLARMISNLNDVSEMANLLKGLFDDAEKFVEAEGIDLVLFIDEAHQITSLSEAAAEALKPILAASGTRGLRVIMATTFEEYNVYIKPNQALRERLERITLTPASSEMTVSILRNMARDYGVIDDFPDDEMFSLIVELTDRYIPQSMQPRKSIKVLDAMVGWHRYNGSPLDMNLLSSVLYASTGIDIAFRVDGASIKQKLDGQVFDQDNATRVVARRLQLCVADLHDKSRPMASFLFAGSTGVGKTELVKALAKLLFGDDRGRLIRFDMSEFQLDDSIELFRRELTREVSNYGSAIILLDEIEKASKMIYRLLYQVLDDGRLSDEQGRQVSFLNTYIVMTTNAGEEVFATIGDYATDEIGSGENMEDFIENIKSSIVNNAGFPEALMGRIDEVVPFQPLPPATMERIIRNKLEKLVGEVRAKHGLYLNVDRRVLTYVAKDIIGVRSSQGGAREAMRSLQREVTAEVATFVNENPTVRSAQLFIEGELRAESKSRRKTGGKVMIKALQR